ncbi:MAG: Asp-tRNA(Asn)/Glu-tRNA(Gln) amidotransferase subunit GatA [Parcubacteria group bacterium]|nr:Asp-tRNA(Asn)/Glu-tRNA(Gln) amidotransferase subunit GatA [Parcubacteria group bacterium]
MPIIDLKTLTIKKAHEHLKNGDFSAQELAESYLSNIEKKDKDIHAYLEVFSDVLEQAKKADEIIKAGKGTLLTGIPFAIKDNILIKGRKVSAASKILEEHKATYDATVIKKLKDEGVVFLGRTNMDEFALGGSTENSAFGPTRNPHDFSRVPGGTSGGSAAAVSVNETLAALGSDTGGSIRQPSSFCGVVGLKPTYGAVSRSGLIAAVSSFDQIGPITKTVADSEIIFNVISGKDHLDTTSISEDEYKNRASSAKGSGVPRKNKKGDKLVVGVPRHLVEQDGIDKEVLENFNKSVKHFQGLGYEVKDINLPNVEHSLSVYYILNFAEVSSNLSRFDGVKYGLHKEGKDLIGDYFATRGEGFGKEVRRRILLGTYVLSAGYYDAYYNKAQIVRKLITEDFQKAWKDVDLVLTPTSPTPAFKIGEKTADPLQMYLADIFTVTANIVGIPAISIPSGFSEVGGNKLPLGIQIMAPHSREDLLFMAGKDFLGEQI